MKILAAGALAGAVLAAVPAFAAVTDRTPAGFEAAHEVVIGAPPARVWAMLLEPQRWWDSRHTYSGDAANLSLDLASGCFCERLADGQVRHMTVVYADAARTLRMVGALGPLQQTGAAGALTIVLEPAGRGTRAKLSYAVGGYARGGLDAWAAPVDGVLGAQLQGLKRAVEAGGP